MDGGRRLLQSVNVPPKRRGAAHEAGRRAGLPMLETGLSRARGPFGRLAGFAGSWRRGFVATPLARRIPSGLGSACVIGLFAAIGLYGVVRGGWIEAARAEYGEPQDILARALGLGVDRITISGLRELREAEVLAAAGLSPKSSLPFADVGDIRARLEALPLVKEASVRKLFPSEMTIQIEERKPFALWQNHGEVFVVAADGTVIDRFGDARFLGLPFVVGEGANERAKDYAALLDQAGSLKPRIRAGMLVNDRRWTLKLDNGIDVRLPEDGAGEALARLAAIEARGGVLDKDILAVDLRLTDRVVVRLTEEAAAARATAKKKPGARGGDA